MLLIAALIVFIRWESGSSPSATSAAAAPRPPLAVSVIEIVEQSVPITPTYLGRTEASQTVEIRARVNGFLEERSFEEGTKVAPGQCLYRIDPKPLEAAVAIARARVASAEARLAAAERLVRRVEQAAANSAASTNELDEATTQKTVAIADLRLAQSTLVQSELDLSYTKVESPIAGIIGRSLKDVGSYLQPGDSGLLATVQQIDPIYVTFSVSEQEILRWQQMTARGEVTMPEISNIPLLLRMSDGSTYSTPNPDGTESPGIGRINFQSVQVDPNTGTALMRGVFANPGGMLLPGQIVRVTSHGIQRVRAVLVPQRAVVSTPAGSSVYVVSGTGDELVAQARAVELGEWYEDAWVITSGLKSGDRVIVDRHSMLRPGARITPTVVPAPMARPDSTAAIPVAAPSANASPRPAP